MARPTGYEPAWDHCLTTLELKHRRRIKTEERAKVVTAVWGTELLQFLAALAIFHQDDLKKRIKRIIAI